MINSRNKVTIASKTNSNDDVNSSNLPKPDQNKIDKAQEKSKTDTTDLIMDFKDKIKDANILDVMKNTGVKNITKYM